MKYLRMAMVTALVVTLLGCPGKRAWAQSTTNQNSMSTGTFAPQSATSDIGPTGPNPAGNFPSPTMVNGVQILPTPVPGAVTTGSNAGTGTASGPVGLPTQFGVSGSTTGAYGTSAPAANPVPTPALGLSSGSVFGTGSMAGGPPGGAGTGGGTFSAPSGSTTATGNTSGAAGGTGAMGTNATNSTTGIGTGPGAGNTSPNTAGTSIGP